MCTYLHGHIIAVWNIVVHCVHFTWAHWHTLSHSGPSIAQSATPRLPPASPLSHSLYFSPHCLIRQPARPTVIGSQKGDIACIVSHLHIARCTFCCRSSFWLQVETPALKMRFHNNGCCPLSKLGCCHCQHLPL